MTTRPSSSAAAPAPSTREVNAHTAFTLFAGTYGLGELRVASFRCSERMSRPFALDVVVSARGLDPSALSAALLGHAASLAIPLPDAAPRLFHGVVTRIEPVSVLLHDRTSLRLRISPRLAQLRHRKASRIFQNVTVREVLEILLTEMEVPHRFELSSAYPKRAYCVQYEETDLEFLSRLCGEEGIFYRFDHGDDPRGAEVVVFADDASAYPPIAGDPVLIHRASDGSEGMRAEENHAQHLSLRWSARPTSVLLMDHDFQRPLLRLEATAAAPAHGEVRGAITAELTGANIATAPPARPPGQVHEHHGDYEETDVARRTAGTRLAQYRRRAGMGHGESACRRLASGARFALEEHDIDALNGEYVLTRVDHEGVTAEAAAGGEPLYRNRFECAPAALPFRPPRPRRRVSQVVETAVVVGPAGQEIHTDAFGRIKVQFHWDRDGKRNEHSSCWIRISQAWAGSGWGAQFIPRIGMEVLVTFLGGDVDRPIVTGCVYNAVNPPPFQLPAERARSGLRTRSTPGGGGFNELSFDDSTGREQVYLHAQRDFVETVGNDHKLRVSAHETVTIGGDRLDMVTGNVTEQIGATRTLKLALDRIEAIGGTHREDVGRNRFISVYGNSSDTVRGQQLTAIGGDYNLRIGGSFSAEIGTGSGASGCDVFVRSNAALTTEKRATLRADESILLRCGESSIEIGPDTITLKAPHVKVAASTSATFAGKGPSLRLDEEVELLAKTVKIFSSKASLELGDDAEVDGKLVKLNCKNPEPPSSEVTGEPLPTQRLSVKLTDAGFAPYAGKDYVLRSAGVKHEGVTDSEGKVEVDLPLEAEVANITLWLEKRPTGPLKRYVVKLRELSPPDTVQGAQTRLRNLGYYWGPDTKAIDGPTRDALRGFQGDHGLPLTGELDASTRSKLAELHGH